MFARLHENWPFLLFYGGLAAMFGGMGFVIYHTVYPGPQDWTPLILEIAGIVMFLVGWAELTGRADEDQ